jgi:predicted nucleotidyltransferase
MFTRKALTKYVADYIKACNEIGISFNKVILFGSYAKNKATEWSDIDLALVSDKFTGMPVDDRRKISHVNIHYIDIEPHTFNSEYFKKGDPFIDEIKRTGIEIRL